MTSRARAQAVLATTGAAAVMVGRAAQGNPWAIREIVGDSDEEPTREEVVAELVLFMRETVRELGERKATGFLKKFYGWYLGRGRFPRPFKQELVELETIAEVEERLFAAAPGAHFVLARLEQEHPRLDEVELDLPISSIRRRAARDSPADFDRDEIRAIRTAWKGTTISTSRKGCTRWQRKPGTQDTRVDEKVDTARPVETRTEHETSADPYAGIHAARERFGGIDIPASLVGMLTALSTVIILAGLVGAAFGVVGYQTGLENAEDLSIGSLIGGVAILFVAYLIGGWAAAGSHGTTALATASQPASGR